MPKKKQKKTTVESETSGFSQGPESLKLKVSLPTATEITLKNRRSDNETNVGGVDEGVTIVNLLR